MATTRTPTLGPAARPVCVPADLDDGVVPKPGVTLSFTELRAYLSPHVAKWWLPERWAVLPEIPKTSVGKFDKKALRALYAQGKLPVDRIEPAHT